MGQGDDGEPEVQRTNSPVVAPTVPPRALAVLFVVSPQQHEKSKLLADRVRELCKAEGAFCAILPSPDLLVWSLAEYAKDVVKQAFETHRENPKDLARACMCSEAKI